MALMKCNLSNHIDLLVSLFGLRKEAHEVKNTNARKDRPNYGIQAWIASDDLINTITVKLVVAATPNFTQTLESSDKCGLVLYSSEFYLCFLPTATLFACRALSPPLSQIPSTLRS